MKNRVIIAGAGIVVVAVLGVAWLAPSQTTVSPHVVGEGSATPHTMQELNSEVQRLSSELAALRETPAPTPAATEPPAATALSFPSAESATHEGDIAASSASETPPHKDAASRDPREQRDRITQSLESRMASEDQDAEWGVNAESELTDGLQSAGFQNTALVGVACRSTLCKVSLTHADFDAEDEFLGKLAGLPGMQDTEIFYVRDEQADGSTQMVLYVGRQGYDMGL